MLTDRNPQLQAAPLSGPLLDAYLDEAEVLLDGEDGDAADSGPEDGEAGAGRRTQALAQMLHQQALQPESLDALYRVHALWMRAEQPAMALRAIDTHADALMQDLPPSQRHDALVNAGFSRTQALRSMPDQAPLLHQALEGMAQLLAQPALQHQSDDAWEHLSGQAERSQHYGVWRASVQARHGLQMAQPERTAFRAWDSAVLATRLAEVSAAEGHSAQAGQLVQQAMDHLRNAAPDQDVDHNDWLKLGERLVLLEPTSIDTIVQQIPLRMPADMPRPLQRDVSVRRARLHAKALHRQELLDAAIAKGQQGRFGLTDDRDDSFSSLVLDWLVQAERLDEAARLAYESISSQRPGSDRHACSVVLKQQAQHAQEGLPLNIYWHLALASAATFDATQWAAGTQDPAAFAGQHLDEARRLDPAHPAIAAQEALRLFAENQFAQALPLLESAAREPLMAAPDVLQALWVSRAKVHGIAKALQLPYPASPAAGWCYNIGVWLDFSFQEACGIEDGDWPERDVDTLKARYYEAAVMHFDAFFATGEGWFRDADVHVYSMLCNNLGIHYRSALKAYDKAIDLHHKGLATSPFAEHHNGLMSCYEAAERKPEFIAAADTLWHFSADHGYGRHDPTEYFQGVCNALYGLDRDNEIAIWLQRLDEWWDSLDVQDQADNEEDYLATLLVMLRDLAWSQRADALARLEHAMPRALASPLPGMRRVAGNVLEYAGQYEGAMALYQESIKMVRPGEIDDAMQAQYAREHMDRCRKKMQADKPWWKIW